MIGLTSLNQVAVTSMVNFHFLLSFNLKLSVFSCNIFKTKFMAGLAKISICISLEFSKILYFYQLVFISPLAVKLFPIVS